MDHYKIYCYTFDNNIKYKLPNNIKLNIYDLETDDVQTFNSEFYVTNYILSYNIDKYNESDFYLRKAYIKNNINYNTFLDINTINRVLVDEYDSIYEITPSGNKLFTLSNLINHIQKNKLIKKTQIITLNIYTIIKNILYLHKKSLYNNLLAPLNAYLIKKYKNIFDYYSCNGIKYMTISKMYEITKWLELQQEVETKFDDYLNININQISTENLLIYLRSVMLYPEFKLIIKNFNNDFILKDEILCNFNGFFDYFLNNGFNYLPQIIKEVYVQPFNYYFRLTELAENILYDINSYIVNYNLINILYIENNISSNYTCKIKIYKN